MNEPERSAGEGRPAGGPRRGNKLPGVGWLEAAENPWGVPVLDVRPVTLGMLSVSKDPKCAANAISFGRDDGTSFIGVDPAPPDRAVAVSLRYPIDRFLADGALFLPDVMECKWAIYLHRGRAIFIRSWLRQVRATADVEVASGFATFTRVHGAFVDDGDAAAFTARVADYLIRTHALGLRFPAPLLPGMEADPGAAAMWCMSCFGKMAEFATPHSIDAPLPTVPLRTHSLLHVAVARGDRAGVLAQLDAGVPADLLARNGMAPLHWALAGKEVDLAKLLLERGSPVDVRSNQGATPLMNAVQSGSLAWLDFLLAHGADPDARDGRGFTALHRAAEMGKADVVVRLLDAGASADVEAEGHTPLSLASARNEAAVVSLLSGR